MEDSPPPWVPQEVLWELGAWFVDATAETADAVIEATMERIAELLEGTSAAVWRIDPVTMQGSSEHRWARHPAIGIPEGQVITADKTVRDAVRAGGGIAVVGIEEVLGAAFCEERGWSGGIAMLAVIDQTDDETVILVIASGRAEVGTRDLELLRGTVLLLRQFTRRVRAERRLQARRRLDDLTVSLAARFQAVSPATVDEEIERALALLKDIVAAESVTVIDVIDDHTISLANIVSDDTRVVGRLTIPVPDMSRIPGADGMTLREFVSEPRIMDLASLSRILMDDDMVVEVDGDGPRPKVALLPASLAGGDSVLAVTRTGGSTWLPEEFDALSTFASLLAQTRGRVAAERSSLIRLDAQRTLAATGKLFLEAVSEDAPTAVHETMERVAAHLGADLAVVVSMDDRRERMTVVDSWSDAGRVAPELGFTLTRDVNTVAFPHVEEMLTTPAATYHRDIDAGFAGLSRGSADGRWTAVVAPIRGAGLGLSALVFIWTSGEIGDPTPAQDLANATADLIGQLHVRLRAEDEVHARLATDAVLSELAEDFLGATEQSADVVTARSVERLGPVLGLAGVALRARRGSEGVVEASWADDGCASPPVGHTATIDDEVTMENIAIMAQPPDDAEWVAERQLLWGSATTLSTFPVVVAGRIDALLVVAGDATLTDHQGEAVRSFAAMLGQFRARVIGERGGLRRLAAQRVLSACASELAEATPDDFSEVVVDVLGAAAAFCDVDAIFDMRVDRRGECYVCVSRWVTPEIEGRALADTVAWGTHAVLDQARESGNLVKVGAAASDEDGPARVAIPRGEGGAVERVLLIASRRVASWEDEVIDLLASLSRTIQEVQARVVAQRYADAAFQDAPIGIVLRDAQLNLITCNQAFADFVGATSIEDLIGTAPQLLYDDIHESIEWEEHPGGQLRAEAAFHGPRGSRVWGQMRASVVAGDDNEHFWLIHVEDVTERRRSEHLLRFQASHDELTGLANRRRLLEEIHRVADGAGSVAVLLLDLDRFKNINDSLGHDRGDELLVVIADRLRLAVRPGDLVARLGGDEFAVVLHGPVAVSDAEYVAGRLMRLIGEPVALGSQKIYPTASIGIAVADETTLVDDLLRRADTAMYRAKARGRARSESFDEELRDAVTARMAIESGLRGAMQNGEFLVHYQPEFSLDDGRVLGAEALIRWYHPEKGLLPAAEFIEVAEETGLVVEMGAFVLAEACREAAAWPGGDHGPMIRVNLAAAQLQREETVPLVRAALRDSGLAPSRLCLEITESAVMNDITRSEEILHRLKALGVHLAVDDFGTGFSSMAYLKRFPVDALKIDRAFVNDLGHNPEDEAFVRAIISLAGALDLDVVAEGVETDLQVEMLLRLGCHRAQGFLLAKPGPASEMRDRLHDYSV